MTYLVEHDIRMPVRRRDGRARASWNGGAPDQAALLNFFANPIYAGVYAYGVRAVERRKRKPGHPGTGRRPPRASPPKSFCTIGCPATSAPSAISAIRRS